MRRTFDNHYALWRKLEQHRQRGHRFSVELYVCGPLLVIEYIVYVPRQS